MRCKATIHNIGTKLHSTGTLLDKRKSEERHILTEEKLKDMGPDHKQGRRSHRVLWLFSVILQKVQL
jgi:hypothetical protein